MADEIRQQKKTAKKKAAKKSPVTKKTTVRKKTVKKSTTKKAASNNTVTKKTPVAPRPAPLAFKPAAPPKPRPVSPEQRRKMIEEAAYFRAEKRGFAAGFELRDWEESEKQIDAMLRSLRRM